MTDSIDSYEAMRYIHRLVQLTENEIKILEQNGITKPIHLMLLDKQDIDSIFTTSPTTKTKSSSSSSSRSRSPPKQKTTSFATPIVSSGINIDNYNERNNSSNNHYNSNYEMNIVKRRSLATISTFLSRGGNLYRVNNIGDIVRFNTRTEKQKPNDWRKDDLISYQHFHDKSKKASSSSSSRRKK